MYDLASGQVRAVLDGFVTPRNIVFAPSGQRLYVSDSSLGTVTVIDTATVPVGKDPYGAALTPDGQFVYAGNLADNTVSVISVASRQVIATISGFKEPRQAIVFTRDGQWAYVLNEDLSVAKVDCAGRRVVGTLAAPKRPS